MVAHELGQWVTLPDYSEIGKYQGVLKPRNLETFRAQMEARGCWISKTASSNLASGRFAWRLYKEDIEASLRTPNWGGVQLLQLQDFPGQGEALIGLLDSLLGDERDHGAGADARLLRGDDALAEVAQVCVDERRDVYGKPEVAHYGKAALKGAVAEWSLTRWHGAVATGFDPEKPARDRVRAGRC